jgi:PAS domain
VSDATTAARPLDWSRTAEWSRSIAEGDLEPVRHVFRKKGASGPDVIWSPSVAQVRSSPLRALLEYWTALRKGGGVPAIGRIDPLGMRDALGYVMLVDVVEKGHDFRYRLYGSSLASASELDMTGRLLSTHAASAYIREFSLATYRASLARREPSFSEYGPAGTLVIARWQRIILPLVDGSGAIVRFLAGAVPVGRDGRIVSTRL